jgi:hypothetical protein
MKGFLPYPRSSFNPKQNKDKDKPKNRKANGIILKQKQYD